MRDYLPANPDAMDNLTLELGLGLGRVLGLELGHQGVPGLNNTEVSFLTSGCRRPYKDGAPPHAARETRLFLKRLFDGRFISLYDTIEWPPNLP